MSQVWLKYIYMNQLYISLLELMLLSYDIDNNNDKK